jgi:hypothetical protein
MDRTMALRSAEQTEHGVTAGLQRTASRAPVIGGGPQATTAAAVLALQRSAGNRATAALLQRQPGVRRRLLQRSLAGCQSLMNDPQAVSLIAGSVVHRLIEDHFLATTSGARKVMIPGASAGPQRSGGICGEDSTVIPPQALGGRAGPGYPDLARVTPGGILQVAEIKPAAMVCLVEGEEQVLRYINQGNATDDLQAAWRASQGITVVSPMLESAYTPPELSTPVGDIHTAWCTAGLMAYSVRPRGHRIRVPVTSSERQERREEYRESGRDLIPAAAAVAGTAAAVVAGRALWRHFWRAVAERFAVRGAIAVGLAAADGPLPFGELIDLGIGVATAIEICVVWNDLWQEADRIAAQEA